MRDSLGGAGNRTEFVDQQREMLQTWANCPDQFGRTQPAALHKFEMARRRPAVPRRGRS